jgi:SAM-dependent methyltransferase
MAAEPFYGEDQAAIHHERFGDLALLAADGLLARLGAAGLRTGTVVDLGCGSGILARIVGDAGYDVVGVDVSAAMVALAAAQAPGARFVVGTVLEVPLPPAVAVTAVGEVLNYATAPPAGPAELEAVVGRVAGALVPGGLFVFDVATPGRNGPTGVRERFHTHPDWALHARAVESPDGERLDRDVTIFRRAGDAEYRRTDEHHVLRLYRPEVVEAVLDRAGFVAVERVSVYGDTASASTPAAGWSVFVARSAGPTRLGVVG